MVQAVVQTTVVALQGSPISVTPPTAGQSLTWSGSAWGGSGPFLPVTGGTLTGSLTVNTTNPTLNYRDTATGVTAGGLWRAVVGGGSYTLQMNSAAAGDFSSSLTMLQITSAGAVTLSGPVTIPSSGFAISLPNGGISIGGTFTGGTMTLNGAGFALNIPAGGISIGGQINASSAQLSGNGIAYTGLPNGGNLIGYTWTGNLNAYANGTLIGLVGLTPSDVSLKQNFAAIAVDPLAVLDKITLQQFDWLPETVGTETYQKPHWTCGFTAQDIQPLIPEAILESPGTGPLGVDMLPLIGYLIGAVQQLSARVGALDGKTA